jgi:putative flippase GtrA
MFNAPERNLAPLQTSQHKDDPVIQSPSRRPGLRGALAREIPTFLIIGSCGFCIDAALTISLVQLGVTPFLARPPSFVIVTLINFSLNRIFTFRSVGTPWLAALGRYVLVCIAGLVLNYAVYAGCLMLAPRLGVPIFPPTLTLFVACGTLVATLLTFVGFRTYAFRG